MCSRKVSRECGLCKMEDIIFLEGSLIRSVREISKLVFEE